MTWELFFVSVQTWRYLYPFERSTFSAQLMSAKLSYRFRSLLCQKLATQWWPINFLLLELRRGSRVSLEFFSVVLPEPLLGLYSTSRREACVSVSPLRMHSGKLCLKSRRVALFCKALDCLLNKPQLLRTVLLRREFGAVSVEEKARLKRLFIFNVNGARSCCYSF